MKKYWIILVILCSTVQAQIIPNWYPVELWELNYCSKWGGVAESTAGVQSNEAIFLSQTTFALQGKKEIYNVPDYNKTLYQASWYFEPFGGSTSYIVHLENETGQYKIGEGSASRTSPGYGFFPTMTDPTNGYLEGNYTYVRISYGSSYLRLPLVEVRQ
ncbi:MAG: hypothetical protein ABIC04_03305 [Nanoarchaeota archaeon]